MYYHMSKQAAVEHGRKWEPEFAPRAELVAANGWVIVLSPTCREALASDIDAILEEAEIDFTAFGRLRKRPATYKRSGLATAPRPAMARPVLPPPAPPAPPPLPNVAAYKPPAMPIPVPPPLPVPKKPWEI